MIPYGQYALALPACSWLGLLCHMLLSLLQGGVCPDAMLRGSRAAASAEQAKEWIRMGFLFRVKPWVSSEIKSIKSANRPVEAKVRR